MSRQIGWFGLGSMGLGMALNLQKHLQAQGQPALHYSNRSLGKGRSLQDAGALPEKDFESLVRASDIIFTMVGVHLLQEGQILTIPEISTDDVLNDLVSKTLSSDASLDGKILVDTSTIHPDTSASAAERLAERGATFIASPVFGASPVAAAGKLIFAMAGPASALETVKPYTLDVMGRSIINMGEDVRKSSLLKICGNILVISFMEILSEAHVFAEKTALGSSQLEEFVANMFGPVLESYSSRITSGSYAPPLLHQGGSPPGFAAALACKDMRHALNIAEAHGTSLPTTEVAYSRLTRAREFAGEWLDSAAMYGTARQEAGLEFWNGASRRGNE
ncbi:6-phosphogluconate dehydrogenase family protein [Aspergillus pseudoustus]|uniref:6-phosphogluconate dehydrogenase family protein n=1 Tax=Aspergillus pseudoustus TaxID=1810923 RepID=A0ABR4JEL1_9EURO